MPYDPPPQLAALSLEEIAREIEKRGLPDIDRWSPQKIGESDMRIDAEGRWYHRGEPITRPAMVRAFASLLTRDEKGQHWLVTPFEKLRIEVEDAPFIAVDVVEQGGALAFRLNTDELVIAGPEHRLIARGDPDTPKLYLQVRRGCEARLNRSTYLQLAQLALEHGEDWCVESQGERFSLLPA